MKLEGTTWLNHGSTYMVRKTDDKYTLVRLVKLESMLRLTKQEMKDFLANFKQIN
jgi:hypothetical protein